LPVLLPKLSTGWLSQSSPIMTKGGGDVPDIRGGKPTKSDEEKKRF